MNLHIITGASKGLGAALADFFAEGGDDVIDLSRTKRNAHQRIKHYSFDLASGESKAQMFKKIIETLSLDRYEMITLTNNAGLIDPIKHIADLEEAEIIKNLAVNLTAPMALTAAFLKFTENFKGLRIVTNISSGVAQSPLASWACYSAGKAGLRSFTQALAKDYLANEKVKFISFGPGIIDTGMQGRIREIDQKDFPEVETFKIYKNENKLKTSKEVGSALGAYILKNPFQNLSETNIQLLS